MVAIITPIIYFQIVNQILVLTIYDENELLLVIDYITLNDEDNIKIFRQLINLYKYAVRAFKKLSKNISYEINYSELLINIDEIPVYKKGIVANLKRLLKHAKYLEAKKDIDDQYVKAVLEMAPPFIQKQIKRLQLHIEDETDIIAWISRGLMELFFMLRYMYSSLERHEEVIKEQLKDLKDIEKIIYPEGAPSDTSSEEIQSFYESMKGLWERMGEYGITRDELKMPNQAFYYAQGADLEEEYRLNWKIHSKYVHPTSYLLFGKKSFVYGDGARQYFWVLAQYYAARNLRDIHKLIEAIP